MTVTTQPAPATTGPTIRFGYVFAEDQQVADVRRELRDGAQELGRLIVRLGEVAVQELPLAEEPGDAADEYWRDFLGVLDGLSELAGTLARAERAL